ncbi:MAG: hypothetical protein JW993_06125 [Sedimentisphaerales bacterium]|nr:hypothetical protein [Sedimentisphaerales bacterium]
MALRIGLFQHHPDTRTEFAGTAELAYFGLSNWWMSTFTKAERAHIEEFSRPHDAPPGSGPLTAQRRASAFSSAAGLLTALAGSLRNRAEDRTLAMRLLAKAEERAKAEVDVLALHMVYQETIRLHLRWRDDFPEGLDLLFGACYKQIAIAPDVAHVFRQQRPDQPLPTHAGFQVMAGLLEKDESYAQAIEMCKQARLQGWSGNWTWRIGSLARKLSQRGNPVQNMSRSGLGPL